MMTESDKKYDEFLKEESKKIPLEIAEKTGKIIKDIFSDRNIPFDKSHLQAAAEMVKVTLHGIPPAFAASTTNIILVLYKLISDENDLIVSPFVEPKLK